MKKNNDPNVWTLQMLKDDILHVRSRMTALEKKIEQMECPHEESVFNKERTVAGDFFPFVISYTETCASCGKELKRYFSEWEWLKAKAAVLNKEVDQKCKEKK